MSVAFMNRKISVPQSVDETKRKVLMWMLALAWLATVFGWIVKEPLTPSTLALRLVLALNLVFHPVLFLITWRRLLPQRVIEFSCLLFVAVVCAGCIAFKLYSPVYGACIDLEPLYPWIPVIYVFAFALVDHQTGLKLSLAIMTLFILVSLPYLIRPAHTYTLFTLALHTSSAALIAALYFFSSYQHRFQIAQLTMDELARMANTDELTGLANRRRVTEVIESKLRRFSRYGHYFSIILFDIDHFKAINDQLGHEVGDQVLKALTQRSSETSREVDVIGRWGGEEFVVILPETSYEESLQKAKLLCSHVAAASLVGDLSITISCGVTSAGSDDDIGSIFHRADTALYTAKRSGRNCSIGVLAEHPVESGPNNLACSPGLR
jgi:diguanylate cyclase